MEIDPAAAGLILAASDHADHQLEARLEAWRDGWRAACAHLGERYEAGVADGILLAKQVEHGTVRQLALELRRWDGLREHFGDPRPGDIQPHRRAGAA
jgi:hypothetical protein